MAAPVRMCRVCRQRAPKVSLTRWVVLDGRLAEDPEKVRPGRGYYTDSSDCAERLPKVLKLRSV